MGSIIVKKSDNLTGEVVISGAKNSALPIIAASILTKGKNRLLSVPMLGDITVMLEILKNMGAEIECENGVVMIDASVINNIAPQYELSNKLRGSFLVAGPLLTRFGKAQISMPGGCAIGTRPIDLHLKGFASMGAQISKEHGYIDMRAKKLHGGKIYLDYPSVGATENIMMAAVLADGETVIENASLEPEIVDLASYLVSAGANISGAGTDTVKISGTDSLNAVSHRIIPDRIEAGTFMVATAMTHGCVKIKNVICGHLKPVTAKLREIGVSVTEGEDYVLVDARGALHSADIKTLPFPGFPTDMQAQFASLMSCTEGTSVIIETVFENRFMHMAELKRMGANIKIEGRTAVVEGMPHLTGAKVKASDLRAGASLVLAGLIADGDTEIGEIEHIDRGYEDIVGKLKSIGANIERNE